MALVAPLLIPPLDQPALASPAASAVAAHRPCKKRAWLDGKASHRHRRAPPVTVRPGTSPLPITSLHNVWTDEILPVIGLTLPTAAVESRFLRCHFTGRAIAMAPSLLPALLAAASHFGVHTIEVVSGYRSPKYNLFLHKKGHEVARDSQHLLGHAIDFRLPGVDTWALRELVRSFRLGGVGYYPVNRFVHCDVGPIRFWRGT